LPGQLGDCRLRGASMLTCEQSVRNQGMPHSSSLPTTTPMEQQCLHTHKVARRARLCYTELHVTSRRFLMNDHRPNHPREQE
jgi:hypothetical protein